MSSTLPAGQPWNPGAYERHARFVSDQHALAQLWLEQLEHWSAQERTPQTFPTPLQATAQEE